MNFKPFINTLFGYTLNHVEIDYDEMLIRRTYNGALPCVSGNINPYNQTDEEITEAFQREIKWLTKLNGSKFIPELVSFDIEKQEIVQKYYEPSCLITKKYPSVDEVKDLYYFLKEHNANKLNGSLSNMSYNGNQLIAFDFKYCNERPLYEEKEFRSYDLWLIKIDRSLPTILREIYYE